MSHKCDALIIKCMDFRLSKVINDFMLAGNLLNNADIISVAGATKSIIDGQSAEISDFLLSQIKISVTLHGIKKIILMHHADCGAYGGSIKFSSTEQEKEFHAGELLIAENVLRKNFSGIEVEKYYFNLVDNNWVIEKID